MKTEIDLKLIAKEAQISSENFHRVKVSLDNVSIYDVLDHFSIEQILDHFDLEDILDEVGIENVKGYFSLTESPD